MNNYVPLLKPGGILIFDDADWPSTQAALKLLDAQCDLLKDAGSYRIYKKKGDYPLETLNER